MNILENIEKLIPSEKINSSKHFINVEVEKDNLETFFLFAFEHLKFYWLKDICILDDVVTSSFIIRYILQSPQEGMTLIIATSTQRDSEVKSVAPIWKNATLFETEAYEMFGVLFNFTIEKKIFPKEYSGFPLRKDFSGFKKSEIESSQKLGQFVLRPRFPLSLNDLSFSLELNHDRIKSCQLDMGFHHIGLEKSLENLNYNKVLDKLGLLDSSTGIFWSLAWAKLIEDGNEIEIPDKAKGLRMIFAELARIQDHLRVLIQLAYQTEYTSFFNSLVYWYNRSIDQINSYAMRKNINATVVVGGIKDDLPNGWIASCSDFLNNLEKQLVEEYKFFFKNSFWYDRLQCGKISREDAMRHALSGPTLRASGVNYDHRKKMPFYFYDEVSFEVPIGINGLVYDRFLIYVEEIFQSIKIVTQVLDNIPAGRLIDKDVFLFLNYKTGAGVSDDVLYRRSIETDPQVQCAKSLSSLESSNGSIDIMADFNKSHLTERVKLCSTSSKLLNAFEENLPGEKLEDLELFWISLGIKMSEVEK